MSNRTLGRYARVYMGGYRVSGYALSIGPLSIQFDFEAVATLSEQVKGGLPGHPAITPTVINGVFDNDASGLHALAQTVDSARTLLVALGMSAEPVAGDPAFCGVFQQSEYSATPPQQGLVTTSVQFSKTNAASSLAYGRAWGNLLHADGAETAVNSGTGIDDRGAATSAGGFMLYQLFSSNGSLTLKTQGAATNSNGSFSDISGASSGSIDASSAPVAGLVALSNTLAIPRYLRWQLVFGTATTATFALAFVRG